MTIVLNRPRRLLDVLLSEEKSRLVFLFLPLLNLMRKLLISAANLVHKLLEKLDLAPKLTAHFGWNELMHHWTPTLRIHISIVRLSFMVQASACLRQFSGIEREVLSVCLGDLIESYKQEYFRNEHLTYLSFYVMIDQVCYWQFLKHWFLITR